MPKIEFSKIISASAPRLRVRQNKPASQATCFRVNPTTNQPAHRYNDIV